MRRWTTLLDEGRHLAFHSPSLDVVHGWVRLTARLQGRGAFWYPQKCWIHAGHLSPARC
jgi:hypothetical protein